MRVLFDSQSQTGRSSKTITTGKWNFGHVNVYMEDGGVVVFEHYNETVEEWVTIQNGIIKRSVANRIMPSPGGKLTARIAAADAPITVEWYV
jgi:hypothetical protein